MSSVITSLQLILPPQSTTTKSLCSLKNSMQAQQQEHELSSSSSSNSLLPNLISFALALSLTSSSSPALAIPSLSSSQPQTTPFTQSKFVQTGLFNGFVLLLTLILVLYIKSNLGFCFCFPHLCSKIRPCPSTNPSCVSTNPTSSSFSFPLMIPETDTQDPIQKLKEAIVSTQKNPKFMVLEDTPYGKIYISSTIRLKKLGFGVIKNHNIIYEYAGRYLEAEVEGGGFNRDVMEFLVKQDVVAYRCMATKVTFVYPFTTAFGDSKGQEERMKMLIDQLGWFAPTFESME